MAYTASGIERRRNISGMAQALSGAKHRTAELTASQREGRKNRMFGLLGKGIDFVGGMARQKLAGAQGLEQIEARGKQDIASQEAMYGEGSAYTNWEMKLKNRDAELKAAAATPGSPYYQQGDFEATQLLVDWLVNADSATREMYFRMQKTGTITSEDDGLGGRGIIAAMHIDYLFGVQARGETPNEAGFRDFVNAELEPMPGFKGFTDQQRRSLMNSLDKWLPLLYKKLEEDVDIGRAEGVFTGLPSRQDKVEQELLQKIMEAKNKQTMQVRDPNMLASVEQQWQSIIDEINEPNYIGIKRIGEIQDLINKILNPRKPPRQPVPAEDYLRMPY